MSRGASNALAAALELGAALRLGEDVRRACRTGQPLDLAGGVPDTQARRRAGQHFAGEPRRRGLFVNAHV